jgi:tryptophan synthase alpha chain
MGPDAFAERAAAAGVDAVLTVDLPIDELAELATPLATRDVAVIPLVAPTSTPDRIERLAQFAPPFVYYISLVGVTGVAAAAPVDPERIALIRRAASAPVAVGFGIRTAADAHRFAEIADGVVVGTAIVDRVASGPAAVAGFVAELAAAMRR